MRCPTPSSDLCSSALHRFAQESLGALVVMASPTVEVQQRGKGLPALPTALFQIWFWPELGDISDAEIRHRRELGWNPKQRFQLVHVENADPSHAQRFGACGQPEILDRANRGIETGCRIGLAAESMAGGPLCIAGDAKIHGSIQNPGEFHAPIRIALFAGVDARSLVI